MAIAVTMLDSEAERTRKGETLWWVTLDGRTAEIAHKHGSDTLFVREKRDENAWHECPLDFNAALDLARVLLAEVAT